MPDGATMAASHELEEIARSMRGAVGSLRAAAETLEKLPALAGAPRNRLLAVVAQESERLGDLVCRMEAIAQLATAVANARAPATITVDELMAQLAAAAAGLGFDTEAVHDPALVPPSTVLDVPGAETIDAAAAFLAALRREMATTRLRLGVRLVDRHLLLDLGWSPEAADLPRLLDWQGEALDAPPPAAPGGEGTAEHRGLRPLARDHDGEAWFILDRDGSAAHVKVLLPLAVAAWTSTR